MKTLRYDSTLQGHYNVERNGGLTHRQYVIWFNIPEKIGKILLDEWNKKYEVT